MIKNNLEDVERITCRTHKPVDHDEQRFEKFKNSGSNLPQASDCEICSAARPYRLDYYHLHEETHYGGIVVYYTMEEIWSDCNCETEIESFDHVWSDSYREDDFHCCGYRLRLVQCRPHRARRPTWLLLSPGICLVVSQLCAITTKSRTKQIVIEGV